MKRVLIVAGEASGDLHGARLAAELRELGGAAIELSGVGGPAMEKAGVGLIDRVERLGVVGVVEVLGHLGAILGAWRKALAKISEGIDLVILIDYPDFNLRLAKAAKKRGVPVVYYISPQLWAWRGGRLKSIRKRVDRMLAILPFEEPLYREGGVDCRFVGHPLLDQKMPEKTAEARRDYLEKLGLDPGTLTIGLLPGSRRGEVARHLPVMLEGMRLLERAKGPLQILVPIAPTLPRSDFLEALSETFPVRLLDGEAERVIAASNLVVVASGTATLQAALLSTPMVILYKVSPLTYWIGRLLIRTEHIGLVNVVAGERVVPELIQREATGRRICEEALSILGSDPERVRKKLQNVAGRLGGPGASRRAAENVLELLG